MTAPEQAETTSAFNDDQTIRTEALSVAAKYVTTKRAAFGGGLEPRPIGDLLDVAEWIIDGRHPRPPFLIESDELLTDEQVGGLRKRWSDLTRRTEGFL